MGLDGGTIISRSDVLRGASWRLASIDGNRSTRGGQLSADFVAPGEDGGTEEERRSAEWTACALTGEELSPPIVACSLGRLYNKESIINFLLGRAGIFNSDCNKWQYLKLVGSKCDVDHLRSLKDVVDVVVVEARGGCEGASKAADVRSEGEGGLGQRRKSASNFLREWVCPITSIPVDSRHGFCVLRPCGHLLSLRAIRELKSSGCPLCSKMFTDEDVLPINGSQDQIKILKRRMEERKDQACAKKRRRVAKAQDGSCGRVEKENGTQLK